MAQQQKLNAIALISGGKDSLYSILHCLKNGHEVVALGNLHPPTASGSIRHNERTRDSGAAKEEEQEDMNSFMYQTIGHHIVPLYEEALDIPLYREVITGGALNSEREYAHIPSVEGRQGDDHHEEKDETESLFRLLQRIKRLHPHANAVSAGAILSTYQRTRIENVAGRLGLVPLAWLWMYPYLPPPAERMAIPGSVTGLLDDMAAAGCEARIIKVASGGLESADVVWGDLASADGRVRRTLVKTMGRFLDEGVEAAVLGEGGEYESLALDGPRCLWKRRILVGETDTMTEEAGVVSVRIKGAKCVGKDKDADEDELNQVREPGLFEEEICKLRDDILMKWAKIELGSLSEEQGNGIPLDTKHDDDDKTAWTISSSESKGQHAWYVSNCSSPDAESTSPTQMEGIVKKIRSSLQFADTKPGELSPTADDIIFSTILLRSMSDFAAVNVVYSSLFSKPNPPARVTVACGDSLPLGVNVLVSLVIDKGPRTSRHGLHVQSRSYWAPANIGPYSQAISAPLQKDAKLENDGGLVYVAGQIPLVPANMEPITTTVTDDKADWYRHFVDQVSLSLQHLWRIGRVMQVDWWVGGTAFLSGNERTSCKARIAGDMWNMMNTPPADVDEEEDDSHGLDLWDIKYGRQQDPGKGHKIRQRPLPNFSIINTNSRRVSPYFAVLVDELPRNAAVEWQGLGTRSVNTTIASEDNGEVWITHMQGPGFGSFAFIGIRYVSSGDLETAARSAMKLVEGKREHEYRQNHAVIYTAWKIQPERWTGQIVPCRAVMEADGKGLVAGIVVHARPG